MYNPVQSNLKPMNHGNVQRISELSHSMLLEDEPRNNQIEHNSLNKKL